MYHSNHKEHVSFTEIWDLLLRSKFLFSIKITQFMFLAPLASKITQKFHYCCYCLRKICIKGRDEGKKEKERGMVDKQIFRDKRLNRTVNKWARWKLWACWLCPRWQGLWKVNSWTASGTRMLWKTRAPVRLGAWSQHWCVGLLSVKEGLRQRGHWCSLNWKLTQATFRIYNIQVSPWTRAQMPMKWVKGEAFRQREKNRLK